MERGKLNVVELTGSGAPIVFLHGLGGTVRYWSCRGASLEFPEPVLLVDLLGFGDSPRPWQKYTIDRHISALHEVLCDYENFALVGHSLGAALALIYAARYPGKVNGLVLFSLPFFGNERSAYKWMRKAPGGWLNTNMIAVALTCMLTRRVAGRLLPKIFSEYPQEVTEDLVKHNVLSSTTSLWEVLYRHDLMIDAKELPMQIPVTCIHSEDDDTAPIERVRQLVSAFPRWELIVLDGFSHHPWLWAPDICADIIARSLLGQSRTLVVEQESAADLKSGM